ncbi:MAG: hypothetical protein K2K63_13705 [Acetatifactor sp.]|nr:hypothetical protein [Acetatifactor sp.]
MKKYLLPALMLSAILTISLSGCANRSAAGDSSSQTEENPAPVIAEGDTITIDDNEDKLEFHIEYINITEDPELFYKAEAGKVYVDFCVSCKNIGDEIYIVNDTIDGVLLYSGAYEYAGSPKIEEGEQRFLTSIYYNKVKPADTVYLHYLFPAPEEVRDSDRMLELNISLCDNDYRIIVREGVKGSVSDSENSKSAGRTAEIIEDGELTASANSEFYVDFSEITNDVIPSNPGAAYIHYPANPGETYVNFCLAYKNMSGQQIRGDKAISAKLTVGETHYQGAAKVEINGRSMFENAGAVQLIPLSTEYVHYLFPIPEEVAAGGESMVISFKIDGINYTYYCK